MAEDSLPDIDLNDDAPDLLPDPIANQIPEPEPEPEVAVEEPTPEPEAAESTEDSDEPLDLSWLDDEPEQPVQAAQVPPQQFQPPQYPPQPQPPQYPPQGQYPPQQPPPTNEQVLEHLLRDPNAAMRDAAAQQFNQNMGPLASRMLDIEQAQRQVLEMRANETIKAARTNIGENTKSVLAKDEGFRGSEAVKTRVNRALKTMYDQAVKEAKYLNDPTKLNSFANPMLYKMTLFAAKNEENYSSPQPGGFGNQSKTETSSSQAAPAPSVTIDPDMEDALTRLGPGGKQKYIEMMTEHGDDISFD